MPQKNVFFLGIHLLVDAGREIFGRQYHSDWNQTARPVPVKKGTLHFKVWNIMGKSEFPHYIPHFKMSLFFTSALIGGRSTKNEHNLKRP